jgi:hypothetical protein
LLAGSDFEADLIVGRVDKLETSELGCRLGRVHITSNGGAGRLGAISAVVEDTNSMRVNGTRDICNEPTIAQKGTTMKSTLVQTSDILGRPVWADIGWPACDASPARTPSSSHRKGTSQGQRTIRPFAKRRHR